MYRSLIACLLIFLNFSCEDEKTTTANLYEFIPENSSHLLQSPNPPEFLLQIDTLPLFKQNDIVGNKRNLGDLLELSRLLNPGYSLICFLRENEGTDYLWITEEKLPGSLQDSIAELLAEPKEENAATIRKYSRGELTFYATAKEGIFFASNSKKQLLRLQKNDDNLYSRNENLRLVLTATDKSENSIFINNDHPGQHLFKELNSPFTAPAGWTALELDLSAEKVSFHGIAGTRGNSDHLLSVFENAGIQKNMAAEITPASAEGFYSFTYTNFNELEKNLNDVRKDSLKAGENHLLDFTGEAGIIYTAKGNSVFLKADDLELAKEAFKVSPQLSREHRGVSVYENTTQGNGFTFLDPLIAQPEINYFCFIDNFIVFAETTDPLEEIISAYQNQATLVNQPYYLEAIKNIAEASSLLIVTNTSNAKSLSKNSSEEKIFNLEGYSIAAIQYVQEDGFAHVHGVFNTSEGSATKREQQVAEITLTETPVTKAFLLRNYTNNLPDIAVQDENNNLYLYSQKGKLQWQKKLGGRITGDIHQVDLFKNGNLQMAFTAGNTMQVLDRNGNTVAPFPLEFKDNITQPLAVFDYDNNRDYRFVITQGEELIMYDGKGKIVRGFKFDGTRSPITQAPKHIRTNNRDYILIPEENGKLHIISRQGKPRITVEERISFSNNNWYLNNGEFVSATATGELVRIDEQGNVRKETFSAEVKPAITATNQVLVSVSENILRINDKEITLDYGLYTQPQAYDMKGKNFITLTDLQANRVYLFNEEGELLPNFPVYGSSLAQLAEIGSNTYLAVQGEEDSIIIYTF